MPIAGSRPLLRRILDSFIAPRPLFRHFRESGPWFDVLVISTLVAALAAASLPAEFFLEQMRAPVSRMGRPVQVTSSPHAIVHYGRYLAMINALVGHPVVVFATAGLLALIFTVLGGGLVSFRAYLAMTAHAFLIPALGTLLILAAGIVVRGHPVEASLTALVPGAPTWLSVALVVLDPFRLWLVALLAAGVGALDERHSAGRAAVILYAVYLVLALGVGTFFTG
jgi:hypothetical protein